MNNNNGPAYLNPGNTVQAEEIVHNRLSVDAVHHRPGPISPEAATTILPTIGRCPRGFYHSNHHLPPVKRVYRLMHRLAGIALPPGVSSR